MVPRNRRRRLEKAFDLPSDPLKGLLEVGTKMPVLETADSHGNSSRFFWSVFSGAEPSTALEPLP